MPKKENLMKTKWILFVLQGTFVLQDNRFRWLARMSIDPSSEDGDLSQDNSAPVTENKAAQATSMHLYFPCGIIRGALSNLGIPCAVSADISSLPACELLVMECIRLYLLSYAHCIAFISTARYSFFSQSRSSCMIIVIFHPCISERALRFR